MNIQFKNEKLTSSGVTRRLLHYYSLANDTDKQNRNWYIDANNFCNELSEAYNKPLFQVAGVCAALSPMKNWQSNMKLTRDFMKGSRGGHYGSQIDKAKLCLKSNEDEIFYVLTKNGLKTSQFYLNIAKPTEVNGVTIDRHAIGASIYSPKNIQTLPDSHGLMSVNQYKFFQSCYMSASEIVEYRPHEFQAIIWSVYRRLKNLPQEYNVPF
jgi:hypothetical protein